MALDFPDNPTIGQVYTDNSAGFSYRWDGIVWQSYSANSVANIKLLQDISGSFDSATTTFNLVDTLGYSVSPLYASQLIINLGGVIQDPTDDFGISGSQIIFSTPPQAGLTFSGTYLGNAVPLQYIEDGSIPPTKLTTGGPWWQTNGAVGVGSTYPRSKLEVKGDVLVSGAVTATRFTGDLAGNVTGTAATFSGVVIAGVVTGAQYWGDGSNISNAPGPFLDQNVGLTTDGSLGVTTSSIDNQYVSGVGNTVKGLVIGNGLLLIHNQLNGDHYIGTAYNALLAGPMTINGTVTINGSMVVV